MKRLFAFALCAALCLASPMTAAGAQNMDMGAIKCADLKKMGETEMSMLYFWMDGYTSHMTGNTVLDLDLVEENIKALMEYCALNPKHNILDFLKQE
jgi:hypothetical protein